MRLKANLQICNRTAFNQALKNNNRHALFSVGRKPNDENCSKNVVNSDSNIYLMVNTAIDGKAGMTYKITNNKKCKNKEKQPYSSNVQVFEQFVKDGKATLRFVEPPTDLLLSNADPLLLKSFLNVLKNAQQLPINSKQFTTLTPVQKRQIQKDTTILNIYDRKDYPTNEVGFPNMLKELKIHKLQLKKIDLRILQLNSLVSLDLSGNVIKDIPQVLTTMRSLQELNLANNKLEIFRHSFCQNKKFCQQLLKLNLEGNSLTQLPNNLSNFSNLITLNVKDNLFSHLPRALFQKLTKLRFLDISGCKYLISLPTNFFDGNRLDSIVACKLPKIFSRIDYRNYVSRCHEDGVLDTTNTVGSLLDITSRKILENNRLREAALDGENVIPSVLREYLKTLLRCYCRKICFPSSCLIKILRFRLDDVMRLITRDLTTDMPDGTANFECIFCSTPCKENFIKSLNLYLM